MALGPDRPTGNALLARLLGAEIRYVPTREARALEMEAVAAEERAAGREPYVIPIGASTPLGAAAYVHALTELLEQIDSARRHRSCDIIRRDTSRARRRLRAGGHSHASHWHQR